MMRYTLGFVGAGNMAEAIARGAINAGVLRADQLCAADPSPARQEVFRALGVTMAEDNAELVHNCSHILLAVKPQQLASLAASLGKLDPEKQIVLSIMAGQSSGRIEAVIGGPARVVRVMPNTPLMVGQGMSGIALGPHALPGDDALALQLFGACGRTLSVDEADLDAITAVSGSGPAYVFYLAEAMQQAATDLGLSGEAARLLVDQTIRGSAELLQQADVPPAELRARVTSPGGTTQAAIEWLQSQSVRETLMAAIRRAADRSRELNA